jgi:RNA polymerase subunit RPABC4/transcription elongation factor Spt4
MGKSFVTVETAVCPVCGKQHDKGLLIDRQMRDRFENRRTPTHWDMCPEHKKLKDDGYVALVEIDPSKSSGDKLDEVWRTGTVAHLRASVWPNIFDVPVPDRGLCFVDASVISMLQSIPQAS